ncbi:hypothetical protein ACHAWF_017728 [Thalassiosira exigua]
MGKKSRKNKAASTAPRPAAVQPGPGTTHDVPTYLQSAINVIEHLLITIEEKKLPIEYGFSRHVHYLSSCDGDGAFTIVSWFTIDDAIMERELSFFSCITLRCHDNIRDTVFFTSELFEADESVRKLCFGNRDPGANLSMAKYFEMFLEHRGKETLAGFRQAPYQLCSKHVAGAVDRMRKMKKVLRGGKEERTIARLYGQLSNECSQVTLPAPTPAPSVNDLWRTMIRPEYYTYTFNGDLYRFYNIEPNKLAIDANQYEEAANHILEDNYRRERFVAMLNHMAFWHMLQNEEEVASWLLWERNSVMVFPAKDDAAAGIMKKNVIFQLMINRFFDCKLSEVVIYIPEYITEGSIAEEALSNYFFCSHHFTQTNELPPGYLVTSSVAQRVEVPGIRSKDEDVCAVSMCKTMKKLKIKKSSCAVCGSTRSKEGGKLRVCSKVGLVCLPSSSSKLLTVFLSHSVRLCYVLLS